MKARLDFVSNSSSTSFIVNDLTSFGVKLKELAGDDTWWMYGLNISFQAKDTSINRKAFKDFLDRYMLDEYTHNDATLYLNGSFEYFQNIDPEYYGQMENVCISASDDNSSSDTTRLAVLYYAMKNEGVDVDDSCTERELSLFDHSIPGKLANAALDNFKEKNT